LLLKTEHDESVGIPFIDHPPPQKPAIPRGDIRKCFFTRAGKRAIVR
jgi:hypothetical protein